MAALFDHETCWQVAVTPDRSDQIRVRQPHRHLKCRVSWVEQPQITVVVEDAGAGSKRLDAVVVGEWVEAVVMLLHHGEWAVKGHPVQQVRHLAQAAADIDADLAVTQNQTGGKAALLRRVADAVPEREQLAWLNQQAVK